jgi:hypothetical protein
VAGRSTRSLDLTEMPSQEEQLRELARVERLRTLRNWALGLSVVAFFLALTAVGIVGVGNPKSASSAYSAMAGEGSLRWSVVPLLAGGAALIIIGAILHGLVTRKHGEV